MWCQRIAGGAPAPLVVCLQCLCGQLGVIVPYAGLAGHTQADVALPVLGCSFKRFGLVFGVMATNSRLGDMMIARGFRVAALGHDRFSVILKFLDGHEIYTLEDFEGMVACRGCVRASPPPCLPLRARTTTFRRNGWQPRSRSRRDPCATGVYRREGLRGEAR